MSVFEAEIDKQPSEILTVIFNAVIQRLDMGLLQKAFHLLSQLTAAFAGYDLHLPDLFFNSIVEGLLQGPVNRPAVVVNVVKVQFYPAHKEYL